MAPHAVSEETRELVREGAQEVKEKLRQDLSRWAKARRYVSLKERIPCVACDGAGKIVCAACEGSGKGVYAKEDGTRMDCERCGGNGSTTCTECAGKGTVLNPHRKKLIWLLWIGAVAWLLIFLQLWGRDILPEQRAKLLQRGEHGKSISAPPPSAGSGVPLAPGGAQSTQIPPTSGPTTPSMPSHGPTGFAPTMPRAGGSHGNSIVPPGPGMAPPNTSVPVPPAGQPGAGMIPQGSQPGWPSGGGNSLPSRPGSWPR